MKKLILPIFLLSTSVLADPHEMKIVPEWVLASNSIVANEFTAQTSTSLKAPSIRWGKCQPCHSGGALEGKPLPDNHEPVE